ncbi:MAG: DUF3185 family protein [Verrucomicrobia bacterium]|nr:DUF3185 family protein [Verrucomicrobiota bacterium]
MNPLGIALVVAGVCFLMLGMHESGSYSSGVNRLVQGAIGEKGLWYLVSGTVATVVGVYLLAMKAQ